MHISYLDIGAHHPFFLSNTALFYERGCTGINIEPDPTLYKEFEIHREKDINLNIGIGQQKDIADFYIISTPTLNTFSEEEARKYSNEGDFHIKEVRKIVVDTLDNVLKEYSPNKFPEFLSLDAEGIDELILKSIDYENNFPTVICTETLSFSNSGHGIKNQEIISFLQQKGYLLYADTNINSIFVRRDAWLR